MPHAARANDNSHAGWHPSRHEGFGQVPHGQKQLSTTTSVGRAHDCTWRLAIYLAPLSHRPRSLPILSRSTPPHRFSFRGHGAMAPVASRRAPAAKLHATECMLFPPSWDLGPWGGDAQLGQSHQLKARRRPVDNKHCREEGVLPMRLHSGWMPVAASANIQE